MPCYNEQACLSETAPAIIQAFQAERIDLELVLVDNGSTDRTGAIIDGFITDGLPVTKVVVPVNRGYGHGIVQGLQACRALMIGYLCADGQVAPEDVVRSYRLMAHREERVLAKVRRRFRQDSWKRKVVSIIYNGLMFTVFGWLGAIDINGSPKLFSKDSFQAMRLRSDDWFLDPEIILKARTLGLRIIEIDVEGYARHGGASHVRRQTMWEFLKNIWRYRTGRYMQEWRREAEAFRQAHFGT
ncbi:MAG: glycosyltransferase family 2 protein, partial [Gemmatimonadales bacterium]